MPHRALDVRALVASVEIQLQNGDVASLAMLAGLLACLADKCRARLDRTVGGSVTPPENTGHLLSVNEAATLTGLPAGYFYRNQRRIPATRHPSKGKVMFEESGLIQWVSEGCRLT
jgi:hypothetical protein